MLTVRIKTFSAGLLSGNAELSPANMLAIAN